MSQVTQLLDAAARGDSQAADDLLPLVYKELRRLAAARTANEAAGHTLQPTALVHEAWLRLVQSPNQHWNGRNHFFMAAAEAMRRILVERARQKRRLKRGADRQRVPLEDLGLAVHADSENLLLIEEALERLTTHHAVKAELVKLRFFVGLNSASRGASMQFGCSCLDRKVATDLLRISTKGRSSPIAFARSQPTAKRSATASCLI